MLNKETKVKGIAVFLDEKQAETMQLIYSIVMSMDMSREPKLMASPEWRKHREQAIALWDDFSDKLHANGWCKDPECENNKKSDEK